MKGLFYSTMAVLFIIPLAVIVIANLDTTQDSDTLVSKIVADKMLSYMKSIDRDLPRATEIMGKRALTEAVVYIESSGNVLNDAKASLTEVISNGTIEGNTTDANFTVTAWAALLQQKGARFGFNTKVKVLDTDFFSIDSYTVGIRVVISVNLTNPSTEMQLFRVYNTTIPVSIEGLNDPVYTLNTNGILKRNIVRPNITVSGTTNFDTAVSNEYYTISEDGAGFLDRLEGRLTNTNRYNISKTSTGLESVVFLPDLQNNGITIQENKTAIDYLYFNASSNPGLAVNNSIFSWLRIDNEHGSIYNLTLI